MINFEVLKKTYNNQISQVLSAQGLTIGCVLDYGISKKNICPNCIFDSNTNKSSNKYKVGGPIEFESGRQCPYCNGVGYYGENSRQEIVHLAVLWDSRSGINFSGKIQSSAGYIQTISESNLINKLESANSLIINGDAYQLDGKSSYVGLGDDKYIICNWKKINAI